MLNLIAKDKLKTNLLSLPWQPIPCYFPSYVGNIITSAVLIKKWLTDICQFKKQPIIFFALALIMGIVYLFDVNLLNCSLCDLYSQGEQVPNVFLLLSRDFYTMILCYGKVSHFVM